MPIEFPIVDLLLSQEGMWTLVRNFMRLFRGVHKKYLSGYLAICEFHINLKRITSDFVAALVVRTCH
jgi:hypothetical protein